MKEELKQFIKDKSIEYHWINNPDGTRDVYLMPDVCHLQGLCDVLGARVFTNGGVKCVLKDGYIVLKMKSILEHFGLELLDVFKPQIEQGN